MLGSVFEQFPNYVNVELRRKKSPALLHLNKMEKNNVFVEEKMIYTKKVFLFLFCLQLVEFYLNEWRKLTLCRCVWGSHFKTYPQSLSFNTCESPGGLVFPVTWYREGTFTRNACLDLKVSQYGSCIPTEKKIVHFFLSFSTNKIFI